jgi:hypothetical protein
MPDHKPDFAGTDVQKSDVSETTMAEVEHFAMGCASAGCPHSVAVPFPIPNENHIRRFFQFEAPGWGLRVGELTLPLRGKIRGWVVLCPNHNQRTKNASPIWMPH